MSSESQAIEQIEKSLKDIYFISGLGADARVFRLLEIEGYQPVHLSWVKPEKGEAIRDYVKRFAAQIQSDQPIIVGLSFGGIVAVEMAKQIEVEKVILLSSAKNRWEIPFYFRLFRWCPLHRIFPFKTLLWAGYWLLYWFFSLETVDERKLLKAILTDTDAHFLKWALHQVVIWENKEIPEQLYHVHGQRDRVFPLRWVEADFVVDNAGHFMVLNRAVEVSTLLKKIIE
jgi:pimeloyl-ACP methyl ester carboxylesterase